MERERPFLLGWERQRLQKARKKRERKIWFRAGKKLYAHTTEEGLVVKPYLLYLGIGCVICHVCIILYSWRNTKSWLWSESAHSVFIMLWLFSEALFNSFSHSLICFQCCARHPAGHLVYKDHMTLYLLQRCSSSNEGNSPLSIGRIKLFCHL